jgi:hypothetical protein
MKMHSHPAQKLSKTDVARAAGLPRVISAFRAFTGKRKPV